MLSSDPWVTRITEEEKPKWNFGNRGWKLMSEKCVVSGLLKASTFIGLKEAWSLRGKQPKRCFL